ncbi:MAG TPA: hypothetical protein VNS32_22195, partial [Flavisolibacter sp.]|nr:hypothetical protein [Flavisolibacter sp.]
MNTQLLICHIYSGEKTIKNSTQNKWALSSKLCKYIFLWMLLLGFTSNLFAGDGGREKELGITLSGDQTNLKNSIPLTNQAVAPLTYSSEGEKTVEIENIVSLKVYEETPNYIPIDFTANVKVQIDYGTSALTLNAPQIITLKVNYKKGEHSTYDAQNYFYFKNAAFVQVTILNIDVPAGSFDVTKVLVLENKMKITQFFELKDGVLPTTLGEKDPTQRTSDAFELSWSWPQNAGNSGTQLEWTWVEDELKSNYITTPGADPDPVLIFKNNSTRVDLTFKQNSYRIPLFFHGKGTIYYRIRGIPYTASGRQDAPWQNGNADISNTYESSLNWQATTSFAEEGKLKSVVQFFDGALKNRQTVTRDNSTNTTLTVETIYDGEGRPAIQVLPTPKINGII